MREAVLSGAAMPSLVREVKREEDVVAGRPDWNRFGQSRRMTLARSQEITLLKVRLIWTGQPSQQVFGFLWAPQTIDPIYRCSELCVFPRARASRALQCISRFPRPAVAYTAPH